MERKSPASFFTRLARLAMQVNHLAISGEPLHLIQNRALTLSELMGCTGNAANIMRREAYELWWSSTKLGFTNDVVDAISSGIVPLADTEFEKYEKLFKLYLIKEREAVGIPYFQGLVTLGRDNDFSFIKNEIMFSYKQVISLYSKARKRCKSREDKKLLQARIDRLDYIVRLIQNKNGLADKVFKRRHISQYKKKIRSKNK